MAEHGNSKPPSSTTRDPGLGESGSAVKTLVKSSVLLGMVVLVALAGAGAVRWYAAVEQSSDRFEILNDAAEIPAGLTDAVRWNSDAADLARPIEPLTRDELTKTWLRAWEQLEIVAATGDSSGLEVYFSNSALTALFEASLDEFGSRHQVAHELTVNFYSADGQQVGLTADKVETVQSIFVGDQQAWFHVTESYDAVLVLEDGNWRVNHWVRQGSDRIWITDPIDPAASPAIESFSGINYYPQATPFENFWPAYDSKVVAADLDRIESMGFDAVRVFLPFEELGGANTSSDDLDPVVDFLDLAEERSLAVTVTLFDNRTDHRTEKWDQDRRHLTAVVAALAAHPALAVWDLKNEPDRDVGINSVDVDGVHSWLSFIGRTLRALDAETPLTIGWSTPEAALAAPPIVDLISFHYYGPARELGPSAAKLAEHGNGRPIVMSEVGLPTWNSVWPGGHTEEEQLVYLARVTEQARSADLIGSMVWTLWDLERPPTDAGAAPWQQGPQTNIGLLRQDGSSKPAVGLFDGSIDPASVDDLSTIDRVDKVFWRLALASCAVSVLVAVAVRSRRRRRASAR